MGTVFRYCLHRRREWNAWPVGEWSKNWEQSEGKRSACAAGSTVGWGFTLAVASSVCARGGESG